MALTSDEIKMLQTLITSLPEDVKLEHINISPNPVKKGESFTIALGDFIDKNHKVSIDIISLTGKKIVSQNNVSGKIKFSGLSESGVYILLLRKNQKDYITYKLFVV